MSVIWERLTDEQVAALNFVETTRQTMTPTHTARLLAKALREQWEARQNAEQEAGMEGTFANQCQRQVALLAAALKELAVAAEEMASSEPDMPTYGDVEARFEKALEEAYRLTEEP